MTMVTERFERSGRPTLVYDDIGDPGAAAVVLLHGGAAGRRQTWLDIPQRLGRRYRVLVPDMRGHGSSDRAEGAYRIEHYTADIEALLEQIVGGPTALVGHSWGGLVAAHIAGTRPELVGAAFFEDAPLQWETIQRTTGARRFQPEEFRAKVERLLDEGANSTELSTLAMLEWAETGDFFRPRQTTLHAQHERGVSVEDMAAGISSTPVAGQTLADLFDETLFREIVPGLLACDPEIFTTSGALDAYDPKRPMKCPVFMLRADPALGPPPIGAAFPPDAEETFIATHPDATVEFVEGASHGIHAQMTDLFTEKLEAFLGARYA